uniref:Ubiquitin carboxyl-terminal hydrolase MINDY n=1 Tax=Macrostomum lignano TaxID=282301 RepID=A0A1I8J183_9PLAT
MPYLLTSSKQEPRSALCAVQAELLRQLLFTEASANPTKPASKIGGNNLEPTIRLKRLAGPAQRSAALARAFSSIVARCGDSVKLVLPVYKPPDGLPWPLIGPENLANQSLLLLLLCGSPVSQVCNHYSDEAAPNGSVLRLAGVPNRCDVGLLSSREFSTRRNAQPYQIGSFLKSPRAPIWLLELQTGQQQQQQQQQQQYVVAFACDSKLVSDWRAERLFELLLLTPELRSRAPGKATVDCRGNFSDQNSSSSSAASSAASLRESADTSESPLAPEGERNSSMGIELPPTAEVSPVEMCLRSKWPGAEIQIVW